MAAWKDRHFNSNKLLIIKNTIMKKTPDELKRFPEDDETDVEGEGTED